MSHLSTDRLAALGDEQPTSAEAAHLAQCAECARERAAYETLVSMAAAERESFGLPLTRWESIAESLGPGIALVPGESSRRIAVENAPRRRSLLASHLPLQIAAGLLLVVGGMMAGRISVGAPPLPSVAVTDSSPARGVAANDVPARTASSTDTATFGSVEEARIAQQRSEALYLQAAAFLARHDSIGDGDGSPVAYRSRLAALDEMISSAREAMRQAPHDPVINNYYITTVEQREATLRQLNTVLPVSLRASSF